MSVGDKNKQLNMSYLRATKMNCALKIILTDFCSQIPLKDGFVIWPAAFCEVVCPNEYVLLLFFCRQRSNYYVLRLKLIR